MKRTLLILIIGCLLLIAPPAFSHGGGDEAFSGAGEPKAAQAVTVDAQGVRALGIKLATAKSGSIDEVLKATGEVRAAETNAFDVTAPVSGAVRAVHVKQNDPVKKGQTLAVIHSIEVAQTLTNLLAEQTKTFADIERVKTQYRGDIALQEKEVQLSKAEYERQDSLFKEGIAAQKAYQLALGEFEKAKVRLSTLQIKQNQEVALLKKQLNAQIQNVKGQLKIMGISSTAADRALAGREVTADLPIVSPVTGVVTFRDMTLGEKVDSSKRLFSVVDLNPIWVMIDVYQEQLPRIRTGQAVLVSTPAGHNLRGTISSIDANVDPLKKTVHVRVVAPNPQGVLRPGAFVQAEIILGSTTSANIVVPSAAIVEQGGKRFVYIRHQSQFEPIEVQIGQQIGGKTEIVTGLAEGSPVVIAGARQLLAQGMVGGHSHEGGRSGGHSHGHAGGQVDEQSGRAADKLATTSARTSQAGAQSHTHSGESAHDHSGEIAHDHSGETAHDHSGETAHDHSGETAHDHSGDAAHQHSGEATDEHSGPGHEHGAHEQHKAAMKDATPPGVSMVMMFLAGIATSTVAIGIFLFLRHRSRRSVSSAKDVRTKVDA